MVDARAVRVRILVVRVAPESVLPGSGMARTVDAMMKVMRRVGSLIVTIAEGFSEKQAMINGK